MAAPASAAAYKQWDPFTRNIPINLYETVRPRLYLNSLLLEGSLNDVLYTAFKAVEELSKDADGGISRPKPDLNFTITRSDPYMLARDIILLNAMRCNTPVGSIWEMFFNHLIPRDAAKYTHFHIHILVAVTATWEKWHGCELSHFVLLDSTSTLKELHRVFKRYEGLVNDEARFRKVAAEMKDSNLQKPKVGPKGLNPYKQWAEGENSPQHRLQKAATEIHATYWNTGRIAKGDIEGVPHFNILFALTPFGDARGVGFASNPCCGFRTFHKMHMDYMDRPGRSTSNANPNAYKRELNAILDGCQQELSAWASALRVANTNGMITITFVFSDAIEYLHRIRPMQESDPARSKILREIYGVNTVDTTPEAWVDMEYNTVDARSILRDIGPWNMFLTVCPILQSVPGGIIITTNQASVDVTGQRFPLLTLFGVEEDTIWTLFGFQAMSYEDQEHLDLQDRIGTPDCRFWRNGRFGSFDLETLNLDSRIGQVRLEFEFDEIVGVLSNICQAMFEETYPFFWRHTAATFALLFYSLKIQSVEGIDWDLVARNVRQALGGEICRSDEFWVHQHLHGLAPEKVWNCYCEEVPIDRENRLVCVTLFIRSSKFSEQTTPVFDLSQVDTNRRFDAIFEVTLTHDWRTHGCQGHFFRNLRVTHGSLVGHNARNYPVEEDFLHVYTGAPVLGAVRDGAALRDKGWTAISFLTGLGMQENGLRCTNYTVTLVNGFATAKGMVIMQRGVLYDDDEKDVVCFSRGFPFLIEDRTKKNSKKNRKKKKKGKATAATEEIEGKEEGKAGEIDRAMVIGGCLDLESAFLKTKQGFDLDLFYWEEEDTRTISDGEPLMLRDENGDIEATEPDGPAYTSTEDIIAAASAAQRFPMGLDGSNDPPDPGKKKAMESSWRKPIQEVWRQQTQGSLSAATTTSNGAGTVHSSDYEPVDPSKYTIDDVPEPKSYYDPNRKWECGFSWEEDWEAEQEAKKKGKVREFDYLRRFEHLQLWPDFTKCEPPAVPWEKKVTDEHEAVEVEDNGCDDGVGGAEEEEGADGMENLTGECLSGKETPFSGAAAPVEVTVDNETAEEDRWWKSDTEEKKALVNGVQNATWGPDEGDAVGKTIIEQGNPVQDGILDDVTPVDGKVLVGDGAKKAKEASGTSIKGKGKLNDVVTTERKVLEDETVLEDEGSKKPNGDPEKVAAPQTPNKRNKGCRPGKKKRRKGKKKNDATTAEKNEADSIEDFDTAVESIPEEARLEAVLDDREELAAELKPMKLLPVIPRTKISFDKSCQHIISRKAVIAIDEVMAFGEGLAHRLDEIDEQKVVTEERVPGIYYLKIPAMVDMLPFAVPGAKGPPTSVKWVEGSGVEIEFVTPGFVLGVKVQQPLAVE